MKKIVLICVAGSAVALAACTTPGFLLGGATPFNPQHPQVYVVKAATPCIWWWTRNRSSFPAYKGKVKISGSCGIRTTSLTGLKGSSRPEAAFGRA